MKSKKYVTYVKKKFCLDENDEDEENDENNENENYETVKIDGKI